MLAVGAVIRERVLRPGWWGRDWETVCRKPWQFSCWNPDDPNLPVILAAESKCPGVWPLCVAAAEFVVHHIRDRDLYELFGTTGPFPTHYHTREIKPPAWTRGALIIPTPWSSAHVFYAGVSGTPERRRP